jgi:hypothetical protein
MSCGGGVQEGAEGLFSYCSVEKESKPWRPTETRSPVGETTGKRSLPESTSLAPDLLEAFFEVAAEENGDVFDRFRMRRMKQVRESLRTIPLCLDQSPGVFAWLTTRRRWHRE